MKTRAMLFRVARVAIAVALLGLAVRSLQGSWNTEEILTLLENASLPWLLGSAAIVACTYVVIIVSWRRAMMDQGERLSFGQAARIVSLSNLGKYAPGRIWSIVGAGVLAREYGISSWSAAGVTLILQIITLATGLIVSGVLAPLQLAKFGSAVPAISMAVGTLVLMIALGLSIAPVRRAFDSKVPSIASRIPKIRTGSWLIVVGLAMFIWIAFGAATLAMEKSLFGASAIPWQIATGVFAASYVLGFVAMLAPAGMGPREAAFVVLLSSVTSPLHAAALALVSRILVTLGDLVFAVPFLRGGLGSPGLKRSGPLPEDPESKT